MEEIKRRDFLKGLGAAGIGMEGVLNSNLEKEAYLQEEQRIEMETGVEKLVNGQLLVYTGMVNEKTFALSRAGNNAVNIFYPVSRGKEFVFFNNYFRLEDVTTEQITLTYLGKIGNRK